MGTKKKQQIKNLKTMKFASIIAIAAVLAFSAEAQRGDGGRDGGRGGRGGRGKIPRRFRNSDGALVGCRVRENPDGPIGGGFMHQNEGEDTYVRTCWTSTSGMALTMKTSILAPLISMFTLITSPTAWTQPLSILRLDPSMLETVVRAASSTLRKP